MHQQLADFAAGERRSHHEGGEGHPRQASAVATHRGETAGAAVQFSPLADCDGSGARYGLIRTRAWSPITAGCGAELADTPNSISLSMD
jgi:hypothetical protein